LGNDCQQIVCREEHWNINPENKGTWEDVEMTEVLKPVTMKNKKAVDYSVLTNLKQ
jgi:hypothetical protein